MAPAPAEHEPGHTADALKEEAQFGARVLHRHGWRLLLVFVAVLLPLWGFAELAAEIQSSSELEFDERLLLDAQAMASPRLDQFFLLISALGYSWGVFPVDAVLVIVLAVKRRIRESVFALLALGGSLLLNVAAKHSFARDRPSLWESISPHSSYSFPSGHAMASATFAGVVILLTWHTRWRWPVLVLALPFAAVVGYSRVYLGVHYPSDILAGWAASSVWVAAAYLAVYRMSLRPWYRP
ncbi:MAG: phosphatase PAP2 family protein [Lysobacter sp.]|nr:phosphatase PAP2 family protein [Lysobacter sp.]MDQ3269877.1 phosphatase PAP2 family protein [Pseudomonadota bacterium]